jgi:hypothetical protein
MIVLEEALDQAEAELARGKALVAAAGQKRHFVTALALATSYPEGGAAAEEESMFEHVNMWLASSVKNSILQDDVLLHGMYLVSNASGRLADAHLMTGVWKIALRWFSLAKEVAAAGREFCSNGNEARMAFSAATVKLLVREADAHRHGGDAKEAAASLDAALVLLTAEPSMPATESSLLSADCLLARAGLVDSTSAEGTVAEAVGHCKRALDLREAVLGPSHRKVGTALVSLASAELQAGELVEALTHVERGLGVYQDLSHDPGHPLVASAEYLKAKVLHARGEHAAAAPLLNQALMSRKAFFGDAHPSVVQTLTGVAAVHGALGNHEAAAEMMAEARRIGEIIGVLPSFAWVVETPPPSAASSPSPFPSAAFEQQEVVDVEEKKQEEGEGKESEEERVERLEREERVAAVEREKAERKAKADAAAAKAAAEAAAVAEKKAQAEAARVAKAQAEQEERDRQRCAHDQQRMEQEDARSLVVETALRAKEEKLRLARERKAREEEERQARRRREQAEVAAEEERRRQALLARERALREEERRANAKEQREYQERLEAAMDERVKERERREEQAAQSVAALPSWFSFSALLLGLRRKDVPPGALSPHASTSPSTPPQRPSITNTNATISFLPSVNTTQTRQQRPTTVGSSSSSTFSVDAKRSGSPSRALRILSTTTSSSFSPSSPSSPPPSSPPSTLPDISLQHQQKQQQSARPSPLFSGSSGASVVSANSHASSLVSASRYAFVVVSPGKFHLAPKSSLPSAALLPPLSALGESEARGLVREEEDEDEEKDDLAAGAAGVGDDDVSLSNTSLTMSLTLSIDGSLTNDGKRRHRAPLLINVVSTPPWP